MAVVKVFAVLDTKAGSFGNPIVMPATGMMVRAFADAVNNKESDIGKHPEDYRLAQIGTYDEAAGRLVSLEPVEWLGFGTDYVR